MRAKPWCANRDTFRFFVYPDDSFEGGGSQASVRSEQFDALLRTLRASKYVTDDPAAACLFFPSVDTLCTFNKCVVPEAVISSTLYSLPYWNNGTYRVTR